MQAKEMDKPDKRILPRTRYMLMELMEREN